MPWFHARVTQSRRTPTRSVTMRVSWTKRLSVDSDRHHDAGDKDKNNCGRERVFPASVNARSIGNAI